MIRQRACTTLGLLALTALLSGVSAADVRAQNSVQIDAPVGFAADHAARQAFCEARFTELPSGDAFREHLRIITSTPASDGLGSAGRGGSLPRAGDEGGRDDCP